jgi:hypothetical protein
MRDRSGQDTSARTQWLLAVGQHLRTEYDALAEPAPARLAALVEELKVTEPAAAASDEEAT